MVNLYSYWYIDFLQDKVQNKKIRFSDAEDDFPKRTDNNNKTKRQNNSLFDDQADESDDELNFEVKKQYEGKKGQKVCFINVTPVNNIFICSIITCEI